MRWCCIRRPSASEEADGESTSNPAVEIADGYTSFADLKLGHEELGRGQFGRVELGSGLTRVQVHVAASRARARVAATGCRSNRPFLIIIITNPKDSFAMYDCNVRPHKCATCPGPCSRADADVPCPGGQPELVS